jgi:HPt (histidine-containing phosphotransfer) domain-containing protein
MLGDDAGLFRSLLGRLIRDFADVTLPTAEYDRGELIGRAARMHKLKGTAGILGLNVVQQLAATIEGACEAGELESIGPLSQQLKTEFKRLSDGAAGAPALAA